MTAIIESFEDKLKRFQKFLETARGKEDPHLRPNLILNPSNPRTSSNLTEEQLDFVATAYFVAKWFPEFKPLEDYAESFGLSSLSKAGFGVQKIIEYEQALGEKRIMQLGLRPQAEKEKDKTAKTKE